MSRGTRAHRILARSSGFEKNSSMKIGRAPRTFQELIFTLQRYWSEQGCVILQPYDMEVGAGTFHTATFLRAVGPEPWRAAYVQPSRRPTDGRYGENPFRLQHYYQYQVVIKPSPLPILDLYLGSLAALGIDPLVHDVRFVEDNWESPTLGAWGLGWEVWLNGMEITQFTYFQQVGGLDCRPVTGEITYGLERLAMYLQGVESIYDIVWSESRALRARHLRRRVSPERGRAVGLQLRARRRADAAAAFRGPRARLPRTAGGRSCRCRRTSRCSRPRIPSICSMRAAPSRSPSGSATSCGCARSRARWRARICASREALGFPLLHARSRCRQEPGAHEARAPRLPGGDRHRGAAAAARSRCCRRPSAPASRPGSTRRDWCTASSPALPRRDGSRCGCGGSPRSSPSST